MKNALGLLCTVLCIAMFGAGPLTAQGPPPPPPPPPVPPTNLPLCPTQYLGNTNGVHYYETGGAKCVSPFGFGQSSKHVTPDCNADPCTPLPAIIGFKGIGQHDAKQESFLRNPPANYDDAIAYLTTFIDNDHLGKLVDSGEVRNRELDRVGSDIFRRRETVLRFRDWTEQHLQRIQRSPLPTTPDEKEARFKQFDAEYLSSDSYLKHLLYWGFMQKNEIDDRRDLAFDWQTQQLTTLPNATFDIAQGPHGSPASVRVVEEGPVIRVAPSGFGRDVFFKTWRIGYDSLNSQRRWKFVGIQVEIENPDEVQGIHSGEMKDRYSFVHEIRDNNDGRHYSVTSFTDLEFGVLSLLP